ncbi:6-phosphogluconolactonase [Rhodovibrio salinarum]|uniref:6-phosphogluconolactonase n=1 Tax=Rhodovibrio salinarum TaxID=1087 RepID=A0A934QHN5_9PROT|nr:6-phosphogluconolactonase [Rhodovibrio salinarum]MBK1697208.1 6-phosphogluconolactonase [Rhodovibrio salinarum]
MTAGVDSPPVTAFPDRDLLAAGLAERVARDLAAAIDARGRATLAVPGGETPGRFLRALAQADIAWMRVRVTLTDERWVPPEDARSNARLVRANLLHGPAAAAEFVPLYAPGLSPETGAERQSRELDERMLPLDVCVLGMGADGHTASLFPGAEQLQEALDPACLQSLVAVHAPGAGEPRVSLSAPVLCGAGQVYLLIQGTEKRAALDAALTATSALEAPVRVVLTRAGPVEVVYAD